MHETSYPTIHTKIVNKKFEFLKHSHHMAFSGIDFVIWSWLVWLTSQVDASLQKITILSSLSQSDSKTSLTCIPRYDHNYYDTLFPSKQITPYARIQKKNFVIYKGTCSYSASSVFSYTTKSDAGPVMAELASTVLEIIGGEHHSIVIRVARQWLSTYSSCWSCSQGYHYQPGSKSILDGRLPAARELSAGLHNLLDCRKPEIWAEGHLASSALCCHQIWCSVLQVQIHCTKMQPANFSLPAEEEGRRSVHSTLPWGLYLH